MPKTNPAAGEAMPETLEDLIARHNAALAVANAHEGTLQGTPEEAELLAAVDAFEDSTAKITSFEGVMDALRMAEKENRDFHGSIVSETLVKGALAYLEEREAMAPKARLDALTSEIAKIIAANPDMMIDHITVYKHGVYSSLSFQDDDLSADVKAALDDYNAKEAIYRPLADQLGDTDLCQAEWEAKEAAEAALLRAPCITIADVHAKAKLALEDESVFDSITNCTHADDRHVGQTFLRSLLGEPAL